MHPKELHFFTMRVESSVTAISSLLRGHALQIQRMHDVLRNEGLEVIQDWSLSL
jgi:methylmalonyl-CoA mutase cobalamin-binding subunit